MNQFEVEQGFIEQCQARAPVGALAQAFNSLTPFFCDTQALNEKLSLSQPEMFHSLDASRDESRRLQGQQGPKTCVRDAADSAYANVFLFTGSKDRCVKKLSSRGRTMRSVN